MPLPQQYGCLYQKTHQLEQPRRQCQTWYAVAYFHNFVCLNDYVTSMYCLSSLFFAPIGHPSQALLNHLQTVYAGLHKHVANTKSVLTADDTTAKADETS